MSYTVLAPLLLHMGCKECMQDFLSLACKRDVLGSRKRFSLWMVDLPKRYVDTLSAVISQLFQLILEFHRGDPHLYGSPLTC